LDGFWDRPIGLADAKCIAKNENCFSNFFSLNQEITSKNGDCFYCDKYSSLNGYLTDPRVNCVKDIVF
jgi:hypothetical protein